MELNYFKDQVFDLLNDADNIKIRDIETNDDIVNIGLHFFHKDINV
jgi:hypothetical protein